jgi:hypothetical protein
MCAETIYAAACIDGSSSGPVTAGVVAGEIATEVVRAKELSSLAMGSGVVVIGIRAVVMTGTGVRDWVMVTWTVTREVVFIGAG